MNRSLRYFLLISLVCGIRIQAQPAIWHVVPSASGSGQSWSDALGDLHAALDSAQAGDQIWVAAGFYIPDNGNDRTRYFELKSGAKLIGGFAGTEQNPSERDLSANHSILSGNIGNLNDSTDNSQTILYMVCPDSSTLVDGFIFEHAFAFSDTVFDNYLPALSGGAVYVQANGCFGLPVFHNCVFRNNSVRSYGGAFFVNGQNTLGDTPLIYNCLFENNRSRRHGGAIYISGGNSYDRGIEFDHCDFIGNLANFSQTSQGGGIYWMKTIGEGENIEFSHCTIKGNKAKAVAGFFSLNVGDLDILGISFENCDFSENAYQGGGSGANILWPLPSYYPPPSINFNFRNNSVHNNFAQVNFLTDSPDADAGGIFISNNHFYDQDKGLSIATGASDTIEIISNVIEGGSGGITLYSNAKKGILVRNNKFIDVNGRVLWLSLSSFAPNIVSIFNNEFIDVSSNIYEWFPIYFIEYSQTVVDSIFLFNNLFLRDTFYNPYFPNPINSSPGIADYFLENNIFLDNFNAYNDTRGIPMPLTYDSCYFAHNILDVPCPGSLCGPGNITVDSLAFVDAANNDYRLPPCSPAINAGNNSVIAPLSAYDLSGEVRIQDGVVDIGPYESPVLLLASPPEITPACQGSANGAVSFLIQNGCMPFTYSWDNGNETGNNLSGLAAGAYMVTIADSRGKKLLTDITIPGSNLQAYIEGNTLICQGNTATLNAAVAGATGTLQFVWSNGQSDSIQSGLLPGQYALTITDGAGCLATDTVQVSEAPPVLADVAVADASSPTAPDGTIVVEITQGTGPFQYHWSTGDSTAIVSGLPAGTYQMTLTDAAGCLSLYVIDVGFTSVSSGSAQALFVPKIYPNPASTEVHVDAGAYREMALWSANGKSIYRYKTGETKKIDVSDVPAGVYISVFKGKGLPVYTIRLRVVH